MIDTKAINALGVVEVLGAIAGLTWRKEGTWHVTRCPFHDDNSPSFKVGTQAPHRGRCYACEAQGDVIELAARFWEISPTKAMRRLAQEYAIGQDDAPRPRPKKRAASTSKSPPPVPAEHREIYARAMRRASLGGTTLALGSAREYLKGRAVLDAAHEARLDGIPLVVGLEPGSVRAWYDDTRNQDPDGWKAAGGTALYPLTDAGLGILIFATLTLAGDALAGLHVRIIDPPKGAPRYLQIGRHPRPWRASRLKAGDVVICEGAIDALSWHAAGVQAIGVQGVKTWRPWFAGALPAQAAPIVIGDRDQAGEQFERVVVADLQRAGFTPRVARFDEDEAKDANELLQRDRAEALRMVLRRAVAPADAVPGCDSFVNDAGAELGGDRHSSVNDPDVGAGAAVLQFPPAKASRKKVPRIPVYGTPLHTVDVTAWEHLPDLIEWAHWRMVPAGDDLVPRRVRSVEPIHTLADAVIRWLEASGGRFSRDDNGGAYLYFSGRLWSVDMASKDWRGWLYDIARIIATDREGRAIACALEQYALMQSSTPRPRPWVFCDRTAGLIAMHLHDEADRVVQVRRNTIETFPNASNGLLLKKDAQGWIHPVVWPKAPDIPAALEALDRLIVSNLATEDAPLFVCWALTAFMRQSLDSRALFFCRGASGSGKSESAELITTLWFGQPRLMKTTGAALWSEGAKQPLVVLDNHEREQLMQEDIKMWLLLASTGGHRAKRQEGTVDGVVKQPAEALAMVTAIEPPSIDELIQRTLTAQFHHSLHSPDYSSNVVQAELVKQRGTIIAGLLQLFATQILPRARDVLTFAKSIPLGHPKRRLARHLGLCALIADACHQVRPQMWRSGAEELAGWVKSQGERAVALAQGTDIIVDALERLRWSWNRLIPDRDGHLYRPAGAEQLYRCDPLFVCGDTYTEDERATTELLRPTFGDVVGFVGSYSDLHADLLRAGREHAGGDDYRRAMRTQAQLSSRWANNAAIKAEGWQVKFMGRSGRRGRRYRFFLSNEGAL